MIDALYKPIANGNDDGIIRYFHKNNIITVLPEEVCLHAYHYS